MILGLMGGGGSILTVPILVYLFDIPARTATGYSLFIVGLTAGFGAISYSRSKLIDYQAAFLFALPALVGVYLSRRFLVPSLPEVLFQIGGVTLLKDQFILVAFSIVMLLASYSMMRGKKVSAATESLFAMSVWRMGTQGFGVGLVTGFVGAGGGFLITPALVVLARLEMKVAVGTSLLVIAVNSSFGFIGDLQASVDSGSTVDWMLLARFLAASLIGIILGTQWSRKIEGGNLKFAFGAFVFIVGVILLGANLLF